MKDIQATQTIHFTMKGMTCGGCVNSVRRILSTVNGIVDADVHVGHLAVTIDPSRVDSLAIQRALTAGQFVADVNPVRE
jgi:copper chaperone CopZ